MRFGIFHPALCMGLLALYCQVSPADAPPPTSPPAPEPSVKRACADAKGATKKECEKVAAKMDAQSVHSEAQPATDEAQSTADYVHHSSPAMRPPAEVAQDKATAKSERKLHSAKPEPK